LHVLFNQQRSVRFHCAVKFAMCGVTIGNCCLCPKIINRAGGIMVSVLASSVEDRRSGQSKDWYFTVVCRYGHFREKRHIYDTSNGQFRIFSGKSEVCCYENEVFLWFSKTLFKQNLFHGILN